MHNCQIIDQLQIPQVLLHPFKPAFFMRHVLMSAFFNALYVNTLHGVCLIKKCVSLCKKHKTLRKPVPVFLHSMWFPLVCGFIAGAVCLSYQVQKWNSASRFNVKGNFPIISRSSLFTDWSQAGFNILMKLKRAKTTLKKQHETKPNQLALTKILVRTSNIFTKW